MERYALVNEYRIRYIEEGSGPTLILVHGLGGSANSWVNNISNLAKDNHVYALDMLGFGRSDKPRINYTIDLFVDMLRGFMDTLGVDKASIVGSSLGGQIAAEYALKHQERVDRLILVAPAGFTPKTFKGTNTLRNYTRIFNAKSKDGLRHILERVHGTSISDEYLEWMYEYIRMENARHAFISALRNSAKAERLSRRFKRALESGSIKALVIWGKDDRIIPVRYAEQFIDMPNCRLILLENCGHRPHVEVSNVFNEYVRFFLKQID
ncbi:MULTISPECIES: alpha/beta fold hydrolase [Candidatus Nitrosocaldus]|jgi:pimeloyl-ACP methyl ester carboxylesterase|uniref:Alpha/beta hydrolase fold protein n=1 Tax=Candidatus Nitrosocaldus cavascurensis TaxID=2058097 RepID=A0A2K5ATB9_9ARCH|nr:MULTISPECIES: alpha/beta fold hydrolase [Candidatus Nitrosocaldus]SPC34896.1 Alpha/beta hydrolase fold protein [Candidatus Nitrosocaldus cavascurensis]